MNINTKILVIGIVGLIAGIFAGWLFFSESGEPRAENQDHQHEEGQVHTCSMHPSIRQDEPGQCPICGMDLIPVSGDDTGEIHLEMSEASIKLASIRTSPVEKRGGIKEISLSGKLSIDERKTFSQTLHFPGRIEVLNVKYIGEYVRRGQQIASIYSPQIITAQEELLEAMNYKEESPALYTAARRKMENYKVEDSFIENLENSKQVKTDIPFFAEASGYVTEMNVNEGDHLQQGGILFKVAGLNSLWVIFDVYEKDIAMVETGSEIHFTVNSIPGRHFHGKVTYINPTVDTETRTIPVRAEVVNEGNLLKPEMFVEGRLVIPTSGEEGLYIPRSAVLWTGERSIVYVKVKDSEKPAFQLREIQLGKETSDSFEVIEGLKEGELVVANGTFAVDAAAQLSGRNSMMNPQLVSDQELETPFNNEQVNESISAKNPVPETFKYQLNELYSAYLELKDALVDSNPATATKSGENFDQTLDKVDMTMVKGDDHMKWMDELMKMQKSIAEIIDENEIEKQRKSFSSLTSSMVSTIKYFGMEGEKVYYQYCPMAFNNQGDYWLSDSEEVLNPYFGDKMLKCGSVVEVIEFK